MPDPATIARTRRERRALPGSSHDKVIGVLRVGLPIGIGVLAAFLVMAPLSNAGDVSFLLDKNKVDVAKERLKIEAAQYRGQDSKGQAFTLNAGSAVQHTSAQPIVEINKLFATLQLPDGPARIQAATARYDMDTEQMTVNSPVAFRAADGYRLDTNGAVVNLKDRTLESTGPVQGAGPQGPFSANRMHADLESRVVKLDGNVHLRIVPGKAK
ncbi:lipopolysaccharide export system protein LptC [Sphingomonas gellani]|uniref:Lipopolysaccharide export system protein LptC n=1 Tax=Sphingomonas gellani TaxID=1166340 RepID=A0A1H8ANB7_9SPHN|nr:LPS export ABC transporter periplasmic protein LptC [Sphingomonas gellani]SEM72043.1 lipopolysaccharide export system protein LptC [Sphingomonas gellani]